MKEILKAKRKKLIDIKIEEKNQLNIVLKKLIEDRNSASNPSYKENIDSKIKQIQLKLADYISTDDYEKYIAKAKILTIQKIKDSCEWDYEQMQKEMGNSDNLSFLETEDQSWGEIIKKAMKDFISDLGEYVPIPTKTARQMIDKIPIIRDKFDTRNQIAAAGIILSVLAGPMYMKRKALFLKYQAIKRIGWTGAGRAYNDVPFPEVNAYKIVPAGLIGLLACSNMAQHSLENLLKNENLSPLESDSSSSSDSELVGIESASASYTELGKRRKSVRIKSVRRKSVRRKSVRRKSVRRKSVRRKRC